jgi:hypothetical protein
MFASKDIFLTPPSGGYQISRSVRLRSSASANLNCTYSGTGTSATIKTLSMWVKRGSLGSSVRLANSNAAAATTTYLQFDAADTLTFNFQGASSTLLTTTQVFRDPSAWYHIVLAIDTTQATSSNRVKIYVNGAQVTSFGASNYPALNATTNLFGYASANNRIGSIYDGTANFFDGYLTEINHIDGQALTPNSFGQTNSVTGVWKPIKYTGTYGTNGFYLNFGNNASTTTLGYDTSGNSNNWTTNNISLTAGVTYDSMIDVPTMWADGGNGRGNYAVLNAANNGYGTTTLSQGNLYAVMSAPGSTEGMAVGTIGMTTGKWYWEVNVVSANTSYGYPCSIGIGNLSTTTGVGVPITSYAYNSKDGNKLSNTGSLVSAAYGASYTANDVIGVAFDADAGTLTFYKNNTSQGTAFTGIASSTWFARVGSNDGCTVAFNFGQRPFSYTPPTGFKALNTQNLPTPTISNGATAMAATLYTGTGGTLNVSNAVNGVSFQPDFVWVKGRSGATDHALYDSVRGTTEDLASNTTAAETTQAIGLTAFGSTGFTVGALAKMNTNAATYVGWQWQAGGTAVTNTSGSITSTVSAGATQGFSVVGYTGTGANATVGHGLGVAPSMIITKVRSTAGVDWSVYHASVGNTNCLFLDTTAASSTSVNFWNNTSPTSTVFSVGISGGTNNSGNTMIAYCFAAVSGYSAFGSYTGNGSADGTFVYLGFRPRYVMIKRTDNVGDWWMFDTSRDTYDVMNNVIYADTSGAESAGNAGGTIDFLSNGFKLRCTAQPNTSTGTFIYAAFAENPFKNSLAR